MKKIILMLSSIILLTFNINYAFSANAPWNCGVPKYAVDNGFLISASNILTTPVTYALASTTGTANCDGLVHDDRIKVQFIAQNYEILREEMVTGKGDNIEALSVMYGCNNREFLNFVKSKYSFIYKENGKKPLDVFRNLNQEFQNSEKMKTECNHLS